MPDLVEIVLASVLFMLFAIQMLLWWFVMAKPYRYIKSGKSDLLEDSGLLPVSVIVYIQNGDINLSTVLPVILEQNYPEFEVIITLETMSNENERILNTLKEQYPNLHSTHIPVETKNISRKKLGLMLGIKAARYENLLFTESDSLPVTDDWLRSMARHFLAKSIVLGMSVRKDEKGFLSGFISFDYFLANLKPLALALTGRPYAGNGRNLAYTKQHFMEHKGFSKYRILQLGEDDLFVKEIATAANTAVEFSPESLISTHLHTFDWCQMKRDRAITKQYYKVIPVIFWRFESWSGILFIMGSTAVIVFGVMKLSMFGYALAGISFLLYAIRLYCKSSIINRTAVSLGTRKYPFSIPVYEIMKYFCDSGYYLQALFSKRKKLYDEL
ncbi:MAG: glycosyl transferase family 2 [Dysgonamonadaceae bacterium]|jgi:glycosyltransferase involved in cell wall biosynthesis|nr:glycosyl transferase family 2 [Dysgonamonadaceae bacterium]